MNKFSKVFLIPEQSKPFLVESYGPDNALILVLDNHRSEVFGTEHGSFHISINNYLNAFDVATESVKVLPGYKVNILVTAIKQMSSGDLRFLNIETSRKCRFQDEVVSTSVFKVWTKAFSASLRSLNYCTSLLALHTQKLLV